MKPTNHLRWIERSVVCENDDRFAERKPFLQQFWAWDKSVIREGNEFDTCDTAVVDAEIGEWRDIPTVKS